MSTRNPGGRSVAKSWSKTLAGSASRDVASNGRIAHGASVWRPQALPLHVAMIRAIAALRDRSPKKASPRLYRWQRPASRDVVPWSEVASRLQRRMKISLSVTERHLYLDVDGYAMTSVMEEHRLAEA